MEWQDQGILLFARPHGEHAAIAEVFTRAHGRHFGAVQGGLSRKKAAMMQPGTELDLHWKARIEGHIGNYRAEALRYHAGILQDAAALHALGAVCGLLHLLLPERAPHPALYAKTADLVVALAAHGDFWKADYARWELALLDEIGFGLDLTRCAVTGGRDDLAYVSPKTGRAVSRQSAGEWAARLFPLPAFLLGQSGAVCQEDICNALDITGYFINRALVEVKDAPPVLPDARRRLYMQIAGA